MKYKIYNGDCIEWMRGLDATSIDAVVTDPPYGMAFRSAWSKAGPRHESIAGDESVDPRFIFESARLLRDGGCLVMFCNWETSCEWRKHISGAGFDIVSQVIWDREHHGMGDLAGGFAPMHDVVWYATKGRRVFSGERPKSVMRHRRPSPQQDFGHPTCKPLSLMREIVDAIKADPPGVVMDPFMGSGSTGVACVMAGIPFMGAELNQKYYEIAVERIKAAEAGVVSPSIKGQMTIFSEGGW